MSIEKFQLIICIMWAGGFLTGITAGFLIGKYIERKQWNKLIKDGKIPRQTL